MWAQESSRLKGDKTEDQDQKRETYAGSTDKTGRAGTMVRLEEWQRSGWVKGATLPSEEAVRRLTTANLTGLRALR